MPSADATLAVRSGLLPLQAARRGGGQQPLALAPEAFTSTFRQTLTAGPAQAGLMPFDYRLDLINFLLADVRGGLGL
jgi:hypothetical protein